MRRTPLTTAVSKALRGLGFPLAGETIVVGLSGGPDSVALLDGLAAAGGDGLRLVAAHLDHGLRTGSAEDAAFCAELCARLGVPLRRASADVLARATREGCGIEEAARLERYGFLARVMAEHGAAAVAVAHTRDDQAETLLLRLLRGAGSLGLGAMRARSGHVVRPLLSVSRQQVLQHLACRGLAWREDPTNADPRHLRNRVRHELLPYLESRFNPRLREGLARTAALLAEEAGTLVALSDELWTGAERRGDRVVLAIDTLRSAPPALGRLVIRRALAEGGGLRGIAMGHVERILELAASPRSSGRRVPLPGGREAVFHFRELGIGPRAAAPRAFSLPVPVPGRVPLPGGKTLVARSCRGPAASRDRSAVVAMDPGDPLVVRTRQPGDRLRTAGREVSLRRFLMERRVPADQRPRLPLVASGRHVLWVPGQPSEPPAEAGRGFVRLELEGQP